MVGSTNFIQQNPGAANQETDAQYQADTLTTGGIGVDAILPSKWLNKLYYQCTTFVAAFAQMMANKGYAMSDANIANLEAVLANVLTTADTKKPLITVAFSPTPTFDASQANGFVITLNGNVTSSVLANMQIGQIVTFIIYQDAVGNRSFAVPPQIKTGQWLPIETAANSIAVQSFTKTPNGDVVRVNTSDIDAANAIVAINASIAALQNGKQNNLGFTPVQQGGGAGQGANKVYLGWDTANSRLRLQVDSTDEGDLATVTGDVTPLSNEVNTLSGKVSGLDSQVTVLNGEVSSLLSAFGNLIGSTGYQKLQGGLILQWGIVDMPGSSSSDNPTAFNFATPFPNQCLLVIPGTYGGTDRITFIKSWNKNGGIVSNNGSGVQAVYFAVGN